MDNLGMNTYSKCHPIEMGAAEVETFLTYLSAGPAMILKNSSL
tara:strand:- start:434 stop:562 length:129 start_codon:yes stop_codon:yes gene_type:complete